MKKDPFEIRRQILHLFVGFLIIYVYQYFEVSPYWLLLGFFVSCLLSYITLFVKIPFFYSFLRFFERKKHIERFPGRGFIFFLLGSFLVLLFCKKHVALASVIILTLGDAFTNLVGFYFGKKVHFLNKKKTIEGTIGGMIVGFMGASFFVSPFIAFFASVIALLFEAPEYKIGRFELDDNVVVPVIAAGVITFMQFVYL